MVTHLSTTQARRCLTAEIGRVPVLSTWYGRKQRESLLFGQSYGTPAVGEFFFTKNEKLRRPGIKPGSGPWQGPILSLNYRR